jgi:hypothetical protein
MDEAFIDTQFARWRTAGLRAGIQVLAAAVSRDQQSTPLSWKSDFDVTREDAAECSYSDRAIVHHSNVRTERPDITGGIPTVRSAQG